MLDVAATRALLTAYMPHDALEAFHVRNTLALLDGEPAITRKHFNPGHITAAAWVLANDTRQVLLIHHAKSGMWFQPGGHLEPHDNSLLDGATREVREECGFMPTFAETPYLFDVDMHAINRHKDEPDHVHFDCRFLVRVPSPVKISLDDPTAVPAAKWVSIDEAKSLMRVDPSNNRIFDKLALLAA